jgi:hypothetical protein
VEVKLHLVSLHILDYNNRFHDVAVALVPSAILRANTISKSGGNCLEIAFSKQITIEWSKHFVLLLLLVWWDLRHQVLRPLLAYCTAPNDK